MSETRTYDISDLAWVRAARDGLHDALLARYRDLRDQYKRETKGCSWLARHVQWLDPAGEDIYIIEAKYPEVVYQQLGRFFYSLVSFDEANETVAQAAAAVDGRDGTVTIESGSDPAGCRVRVALDAGDRITIELTETRPYRLPRINYRYKRADQIGGCREKQ